jgi:hypothetical protein
VKLFPEKTSSIEFNSPSTGSEFLDTWKKGDFIRKASQYIEDSLEKDLIVCRISDIQETEWPTVEIYKKKIESCSKELGDYIATHEDPFILK